MGNKLILRIVDDFLTIVGSSTRRLGSLNEALLGKWIYLQWEPIVEEDGKKKVLEENEVKVIW